MLGLLRVLRPHLQLAAGRAAECYIGVTVTPLRKSVVKEKWRFETTRLMPTCRGQRHCC
jgi:hypothetical protein